MCASVQTANAIIHNLGSPAKGFLAAAALDPRIVYGPNTALTKEGMERTHAAALKIEAMPKAKRSLVAS
jgi:hypothetical protein